MPFGNILTWEERLGEKTDETLELTSPFSNVKDLYEGEDGMQDMGDLVVVTHKDTENGVKIHGTLVVEDGKKKELLRVRAGATAKVKVKNKVAHGQSFLNVQVIEVTGGAAEVQSNEQSA